VVVLIDISGISALADACAVDGQIGAGLVSQMLNDFLDIQVVGTVYAPLGDSADTSPPRFCRWRGLLERDVVHACRSAYYCALSFGRLNSQGCRCSV
jgi:hypothetical protein